ncbi:CocE/NonD family hydrolase [Bifidobacterium pseudocatenulatum]|uniref:CocE/NonD family hydrolase n=1 Tax=Bifidobacterium pseudocatenulatum TaxID=28026 RepID=UPI0022E6BD6F|nr:CocE/NonD family hydrolase [Bifidobacterium pseudocatenulatum]
MTQKLYEVDVLDHVEIRLSDGKKLSAKMWMPRPTEVVMEGVAEVFPVVLEAIPYRKDDVCLIDDAVRFGYVSERGYVCVRLDLRGSGDSEGVLDDEYSPREQLDICEVIEWLAAQQWCNGNVGMTGISWSGFNSLQVASHTPEHLKAIITTCSTDDRYDNDVHYMGGSLLAFYMNWWGAIMHEFNVRPPDPALVGDSWKSRFIERLSENTNLSELWMSHQRRDAYWKQGSVIENYDAIQCAVMAVGGWADSYTDAILRLMKGLNKTPCNQAIIGPWGHTWPERGVPGPSIGYLQACVRWWDKWLKGINNGAQNDPTIRFYTQDSAHSTPDMTDRDGAWYQADAFHTGADAEAMIMPFGGALACEPSTDPESFTEIVDASRVKHRSALVTGTQVDTWLPMGSPIDLPQEQTPDDKRSLCFTSAPLEEDLVISGQPVVKLRVGVDGRQGFVFARLCDVWPDGTSELITRGNLNLCHRNSHEFPEPCVPGESYDVAIPLKNVSQRIPVGHRLRVSLSTSYWIWIWPSAVMAPVTVDMAHSGLCLPPAPDGLSELKVPFEPAVNAPAPSVKQLRETHPYCRRFVDEETGEVVYRRSTDGRGDQLTPSGLRFWGSEHTDYRINPDDPLTASMNTVRQSGFERPGWKATSKLESKMCCDLDDFIVTTHMAIAYNGKNIHDETSTVRIPRDFN